MKKRRDNILFGIISDSLMNIPNSSFQIFTSLWGSVCLEPLEFNAGTLLVEGRGCVEDLLIQNEVLAEELFELLI